MDNKWTLEEYENLFDNYSTKGNELIPELGGRAPLTVKNKAYVLGQSFPSKLSDEESRFLHEHGNSLKEATAFFLNGHSPKEVASIIGSM